MYWLAMQALGLGLLISHAAIAHCMVMMDIICNDVSQPTTVKHQEEYNTSSSQQTAPQIRVAACMLVYQPHNTAHLCFLK